MACVESMENLSLLDSSQPAVSENRTPNHPVKEKIFAAKIDNIHTDFVITEFQNRVFIVVTQLQKFATLVSVTKTSLRNIDGDSEDVYTVKTIFGGDSDSSQHLVARFLTEHTSISKPALFAIGLKDHSPRTVRALRDIINTNKTW